MHRIALVRLRYDRRTRAYARRRSNENLSKKDILRCLKSAIAREIHHVLTNPTTTTRPDLRAIRQAPGLTLTDAATALEPGPHASPTSNNTPGHYPTSPTATGSGSKPLDTQ